MPKPNFPYQPFIELQVNDNQALIVDRLFIEEESIVDGKLSGNDFYQKINTLVAKLGYPLSELDVIMAYGTKEFADKQKAVSIDTGVESFGNLVIDHRLYGFGNQNYRNKKAQEKGRDGLNQYITQQAQYEQEGEDDNYHSSEVTVSAFINEVAAYNDYRQSNEFLSSQVSIMITPSNDDDMTDSKSDWLHYHVNNYMIRGYKLYIENTTKTGAKLLQYIIDSRYNNCVLVLDGEPTMDIGNLQYQPIDACLHNGKGQKTVFNVMERFAEYLLNPSLESVKQFSALTKITKHL